jgi:hypothetical protein
MRTIINGGQGKGSQAQLSLTQLRTVINNRHWRLCSALYEKCIFCLPAYGFIAVILWWPMMARLWGAYMVRPVTQLREVWKPAAGLSRPQDLQDPNLGLQTHYLPHVYRKLDQLFLNIKFGCHQNPTQPRSSENAFPWNSSLPWCTHKNWQSGWMLSPLFLEIREGMCM